VYSRAAVHGGVQFTCREHAFTLSARVCSCKHALRRRSVAVLRLAGRKAATTARPFFPNQLDAGSRRHFTRCRGVDSRLSPVPPRRRHCRPCTEITDMTACHETGQYAFPGLFTAILLSMSVFYLLVFPFFHNFLVVGSVRQIKLHDLCQLLTAR